VNFDLFMAHPSLGIISPIFSNLGCPIYWEEVKIYREASTVKSN